MGIDHGGVHKRLVEKQNDNGVVLVPCFLAWIDLDLARWGFDVIAALPDGYQNILYVTILAGLGLKGQDKF